MRAVGGILTAAVLLVACGGTSGDPAGAGPTPGTPATTSGPGPAGAGSSTAGSGAAGKPSPVPTPTTPPKHRGTRETTLGAVSIFEPADPVPASAPVVLFTQGTGPAAYRGWIDHLVAAGSIVVYQDATTDATAAAGLRLAVRTLARGHVEPRWDRLTLVGHSIGGVLSTRLAATAAAQRLPRPVALVAVQPPAPEDPPGRLPAGLRVVVVAGDRDDRVADGPKQLWAALSGVPAADRDYVLIRSDDRGDPPLEATHYFPLTDETDALDRVLWGLLDSVLAGRPLAPDAGAWSDGSPVTPPQVTDDP